MRPQKSNRKVARPCSERLFQNTNETDWLTGDELMGNEGSYVALGLKTWNAQIERADKLFAGFSSEEILREIAPGRNRLLYLWGHLTAVHDAMLPLLSLGERLHPELDRKSTRLNSSHVSISYAVFCLKKKKNKNLHLYSV